MFDSKKIDDYFIPQKDNKDFLKSAVFSRHKTNKYLKLFLPALAALLTGLLIIIPQLKKDLRDIADDIITITILLQSHPPDIIFDTEVLRFNFIIFIRLI